MEYCRLIYRSVATDDVVSNEDIRNLVETAAANNRKNGITGLLLLSGNRFLQVLEGPFSAVNRLFGNIVRDPRHHAIELIDFSALDAPFFREWDMRLADLYDLPAAPRALFATKYRNKDGGIEIPTDLPTVFSLLLDAKAACLSTPWKTDDSSEAGSDAAHPA